MGLMVLAAVLIPNLGRAAGDCQFDLRQPNACNRIDFVAPGDERVAPQVYVVKTKRAEAPKRVYVASGPYRQITGLEIAVSGNAAPGETRRANPTGYPKTVGITLRGQFVNGEDRDVSLTIATNLLSDATTLSERDRVSVRAMKFKDGYYLVAGIGAERLSQRDVSVRDMSDALGDLRALARQSVTSENGVSTLSVTAAAGIGAPLVTRARGVDVYFIPQVVAQVSHSASNSQVEVSGQGGVRLGRTTVSAYGEYDVSLEGTGRVFGFRLDRELPVGGGAKRTGVFIAVENRRDAIDTLYSGGDKRQNYFQFLAGITHRFGKGSPVPMRASALR